MDALVPSSKFAQIEKVLLETISDSGEKALDDSIKISQEIAATSKRGNTSVQIVNITQTAVGISNALLLLKELQETSLSINELFDVLLCRLAENNVTLDDIDAIIRKRYPLILVRLSKTQKEAAGIMGVSESYFSKLLQEDTE